MMTTASFIVFSFYLLVWQFSKQLAMHIPVSQPPEVIAALGTPVKLLCYFNCSCPGRAYGGFSSSYRKVFANVTCTTVDQEKFCESKSIIVNTTLDDEKTFICNVKIPGENTSFEGEGSGTKVILYAEPSSVEIKEDNPLVEGRSANLTCMVRGMHPQNITLSWFRNDLFSALPNELTSTPILTSFGEIQSVLSFTPNINDHGTSYWCQASHPLWRRNVTQHKLLDVKSGPRTINVTILKGLETLNDLSKFLVIPKHTYIELSCSADGNPKPLIMWFHEKEDYKNSIDSSLVIHKHILVIKEMTKESEGLYTCVANNSYGMINVTVSISATEGTGINLLLIYFTIIVICNIILMMACLGFCLLVKQKGMVALYFAKY
ncbi:myelin-associated glycoprotein-like isoform X2 [Erpetoichthys calabaricus]|uniref:myelin-associated glycoprotein-like isoform X2 n=1 Tax=Erpetoichthys calabaricus TaxID=27687 RepID=UPI0022348747|nr:myelin-associated glycoprotein-like isoform X2 [Erpetoichthys calabaricus]